MVTPTPTHFCFDDHSVTVAELERLLDAMEASPRIPFPARDVFHRSLRSPERETRALTHALSSTLRAPDSTLVGFLRIVTDHAYFYYLCDVMIHPAWQAQGLGRQLVDQAVQECRRRGYMKIFLTSLPGLESFYAQFGFRPTMSPVLTLRGEDDASYPPLP
jgi:GNAT superfamily N-acetyltransferase